MENTRVSAADVQITGILDMRSNEVTGLDTDLTRYPLREDQGTTKLYVDTVRNDIVDNLPVLVDNGDF
jgi:hypothetical protein